MTTARVLTDPRVRLGAGTAALLVTAMAARRNRVGPGEAAAFRAVNDLPGWLCPFWIRIRPASITGRQIPDPDADSKAGNER